MLWPVEPICGVTKGQKFPNISSQGKLSKRTTSKFLFWSFSSQVSHFLVFPLLHMNCRFAQVHLHQGLPIVSTPFLPSQPHKWVMGESLADVKSHVTRLVVLNVVRAKPGQGGGGGGGGAVSSPGKQVPHTPAGFGSLTCSDGSVYECTDFDRLLL